MADTQAVRVGDIFRESWGYDQTNINFYEVVSVSPSGLTCTLRAVEVGTVQVGDGWRVVPIPGRYVTADRSSVDGGSGAPFRRKIGRGWQGQPYLRMTSYSGASLWDGTPAFDTIAAGLPGH